MAVANITKTINRKRAAIATKIFNDNFVIIKADDLEKREICYSLRYQIFRSERGFDIGDDIFERETDQFDDHAVSFLIKHIASGIYIGTGRLIITDNQNSNAMLPVQHYLPQSALAAFGLAKNDCAKKTCEISRLGILRAYRNPRHIIYANAQGTYGNFLKSHIVNICKLGLYRAVFDFALNHTHTPNCVFLTDPLLLRRFEDAGFKKYTVMGEDLDIFGRVTPVHFNIYSMLAHSKEEQPVHWSVVTDNGRILFPEPADFSLLTGLH